MFNIPADDNNLILPVAFQFDRTERLRETIEDMSREELIDLNKFLYRALEKHQGRCEAANDELERVLGYRSPMSHV